MAILPGIARVNFLSQYASGQSVSNTFYVANEGSSAPDLADLAALASDLEAWFVPTYRALLVTSDIFKRISVYQVSDDLTVTPPLESILQVNLAGLNGGGARQVPDSLAAVMSIKTPVAGRSNRGHLFLPNFPFTAGLNGDLWSSSAVTYFAAILAKFQAGCQPSPTWTGSTLSAWNLAVFSRKVASESGDSVTGATATILNPSVRWLRSRERGTT